MKRVGYIGLGIMGSAMALNLIKAGFQLTVWNRTRSRAKEVLEKGAKWADSPAAVAAGVEAVCINVTDTPDVERVIFGPGGIVEGNPGDIAELVVIDHSTISPAATRDFSARLGQQGIYLLDAPVTGGDIGAQNGTLSIMVGGSFEAFDRCTPIFRAVGKSITHMGDSGSGQACKACNQVLGAINLVGVCEAMALAKKEGLDLAKMLEVVTAGAASNWALANLGPKIYLGDMAPGFMIDLANKDLRIARDEMDKLGLPLPVAAVAMEMFRSAATLGHGSDGIQAVSRVYQQLAAMIYRGR